MKSTFYDKPMNRLILVYWDRDTGISSHDLKIMTQTQRMINEQKLKPKTEDLLNITIHKN